LDDDIYAVNVFSDLPAAEMAYVWRIEDILIVGARIVPVGPIPVGPKQR